MGYRNEFLVLPATKTPGSCRRFGAFPDHPRLALPLPCRGFPHESHCNQKKIACPAMPFGACLNPLLFLAAMAFPGWAAAAPYLPKNDAVVLETLPGKRSDPAAAELRELRAAAAAAPKDAGAAGRLARRYFDLAMEEGDPRYVGYPHAVLRALPEVARTPARLLVLHGKPPQYRP